MKKSFKIFVICFMVLLMGSVTAQVKAFDEKPDYLSDEERVEETGEIVKVSINEHAYLEMDAVYVEPSMSAKDMSSLPQASRDGGAGGVVAPLFIYKTITLTKSTHIFSETTEYNNGFWYKGTLTLQSTKRNNDGSYTATYTGSIIRGDW